MKYRICENKNHEFKIQKKWWTLFFSYWKDVKRDVKRSYRLPNQEGIPTVYNETTTLFDNFIAAENHIIKLKSKKKKKEEVNSWDHIWECRGEY